eukprot:scaffold4678_cov242-Pinguiococcus_pyrenoidosus.AAC.8
MSAQPSSVTHWNTERKAKNELSKFVKPQTTQIKTLASLAYLLCQLRLCHVSTDEGNKSSSAEALVPKGIVVGAAPAPVLSRDRIGAMIALVLPVSVRADSGVFHVNGPEAVASLVPGGVLQQPIRLLVDGVKVRLVDAAESIEVVVELPRDIHWKRREAAPIVQSATIKLHANLWREGHGEEKRREQSEGQ